ncbi:hypothetical protein T4B_7495 [Trichinella pseudospiralis]|uniref:Uncharacterized protein n=1 Tax=Trichinella pseudospiralis TaxID=6337 RepID=A0A0V1H1L9_TRIPS|nr:hypothetical protein T4B_7495 [Trichinella pseudospiralis]
MENVIWFHTIFSSVVPKTLLPKRVLAPTDFGHSLIHHYQSRTKLFCTVGAYVEKTRQLVDIRRTHTYYSSLRRSSLSLLKDLSCSSPLHYIEGVYRRGSPDLRPFYKSATCYTGALIRCPIRLLATEQFTERRQLGTNWSGLESWSPEATHVSHRRWFCTRREKRFYCRSSTPASARPAMSNAAILQWLLHM